MTKILDLAKTYEQKSKQERERIETEARNDIAQLRQNIKDALTQSEQSIKNDILTAQTNMSRAVFKPYLWSLGALLALALILTVAIAVLSWQTKAATSEYKQAKQSLDLMTDKTNGITITNCTLESGKSKLCAKLDKAYLGKTWGGKKATYMILEQK